MRSARSPRESRTWWPLGTHSISVGPDGEHPPEQVVFEQATGGRVYEIAQDGRECDWATILAYEPPHRIVLEWTVNPAAPPTEVEVLFTPDGDGTIVEVEHRGWERYAEGGDHCTGFVRLGLAWRARAATRGLRAARRRARVARPSRLVGRLRLRGLGLRRLRGLAFPRPPVASAGFGLASPSAFATLVGFAGACPQPAELSLERRTRASARRRARCEADRARWRARRRTAPAVARPRHRRRADEGQLDRIEIATSRSSARRRRSVELGDAREQAAAESILGLELDADLLGEHRRQHRARNDCAGRRESRRAGLRSPLLFERVVELVDRERAAARRAARQAASR